MTEVKLKLGAGSYVPCHYYQGYLDIDIMRYRNLELVCDLRGNLPFKDECIDEIASRHFIDMLSYLEVARLLKECYRVLKHGGLMWHEVPNIRSAAKTLAKYGVEATWIQNIFWGFCPGPKETIFKKCGFDGKLLRQYFENAGFHNVMITEGGPREQIESFELRADGVKQ